MIDDWGFEEWVDVYSTMRLDTYLVEWSFKVKRDLTHSVLHGITGW